MEVDLVTPIVDGKAVKNTTDSTKKEAKAGGELGKDAFLQLLVAQMQNQDPLEPQANSDYIAQLATYSQVEELQNIGKTMDSMQAFNLVGKTVDLTNELSNGTKEIVTGMVDKVTISNGTINLLIGGKQYDLNELTNVYDADYYNSLKKE